MLYLAAASWLLSRVFHLLAKILELILTPLLQQAPKTLYKDRAVQDIQSQVDSQAWQACICKNL